MYFCVCLSRRPWGSTPRRTVAVQPLFNNNDAQSERRQRNHRNHSFWPVPVRQGRGTRTKPQHKPGPDLYPTFCFSNTQFFLRHWVHLKFSSQVPGRLRGQRPHWSTSLRGFVRRTTLKAHSMLAQIEREVLSCRLCGNGSLSNRKWLTLRSKVNKQRCFLLQHKHTKWRFIFISKHTNTSCLYKSQREKKNIQFNELEGLRTKAHEERGMVLLFWNDKR